MTAWYRPSLLLSILIMSLLTNLTAQPPATPGKSSIAYSPIVLKLNEDGSNYLRLLTWHQFWLSSSDLSDPEQNLQVTPTLRRSRMALLARLSSKVLIWTHIGMNNLSPQNQSPLGGGTGSPQLFVHGAWGEIELHPFLQVGGGLHYWNGMTRLNSASTMTFMTLDQSRPYAAWHSLGVTDQFGRHLGIYLKGQIGKVDYRLALNAPTANSLDDGRDYGLRNSKLQYNGAQQTDLGGRQVGQSILTGYVRYQILDGESNLLPFQTGTYLGKKSVFNVGAGFFLHPNGMYCAETQEHSTVRHYAVDAYLDKPVAGGNAISAYLAYQHFDFGDRYVSRWVGTGGHVYGQLGFYLKKLQLMPYAAWQRGYYEGLQGPVSTLDLGLNYFIHAHNAKLTLEYHRMQGDIRETSILGPEDYFSLLRLQFQVFL